MKEKVITLYEYLYGISSGNQNFEYHPTERETKIIDNFIEKLTPSHGEEWLFDFLCYQFSRYIDQNTRYGKGKIMIGWVLGDKAIQKFKEASEEERYYGEQFKVNFNVQNPIKQPIETVEISKDYKNRERSRFYGTERGLIHCNENSLYEELNKFCMTCKFKGYCK